ncbi:hypothetical protein [Pyxidicoccus trucidator]|uniref:hypothetical protein n=1 Tax=Pyxidicoccus trucidator TaxID=2709662 RepID=UPI003B838C0C
MWTTFALDLLWEGGVTRRPARNVRLATARALKGKAGGVEQAMEMLGGPDVPGWAPGRAGRRILALESVPGFSLRIVVTRDSDRTLRHALYPNGTLPNPLALD